MGDFDSLLDSILNAPIGAPIRMPAPQQVIPLDQYSGMLAQQAFNQACADHASIQNAPRTLTDWGAGLQNAYKPAAREPLDPTADATFDAWCAAKDLRTIEEFAADGGLPSR